MTTVEFVIFGVIALLVAVPQLAIQALLASSTAEPRSFLVEFWVVTAASSGWNLLVVGYPWFASEWIEDSNGSPHEDGLDAFMRGYFIVWLLFVVAVTAMSWVLARRVRKVKHLLDVCQASASVRTAARVSWFAYLAFGAFLLQALIF